MKSRSASEILQAYKISTKILVQAGLKPQLQRLDNECSEALKEYMRDEHVDFQLAPPGVHRRNAAERAIRTFKNHFIAALCSTDKEFPLHLWDQLLPQALISLNLLRGSRINPKLSAWAQVNGQFDYNRTPLAPPGTRVLVHEKPSARDSWSPHSVDGWYIGPALESYRCFKVWIWDSRTLEWFPSKVTLPLASSIDLIIAAANDIVHALNHPSAGSPLAPLANSEVETLRNVAEILTNCRDGPPSTANPTAATTAAESPKQVSFAPTVPAPTQNQPASILRVQKPATIAHPAAAAPLRVASPLLGSIPSKDAWTVNQDWHRNNAIRRSTDRCPYLPKFDRPGWLTPPSPTTAPRENHTARQTSPRRPQHEKNEITTSRFAFRYSPQRKQSHSSRHRRFIRIPQTTQKFTRQTMGASCSRRNWPPHPR